MKRIDLVKKGGFAAGEHLVAVDVPVPVPSDDEVLVEVKASAVNPVDFKQAEYGFMLPDPLPAALGCDVAGVVVKAPAAHAGLQGKRVVTYLGADKSKSRTSRGAFVEQVAVDADLIAEIPDQVSFAEAAALPVAGLTAQMLLNELSLSEGSWVLVWGASSSVGYSCIQLAVRRGLKAIGVASGKHEESVMSLGAAGFVDYKKDDVMVKVKEICNEHLNTAVDTIGLPDTFGTCAELVKVLGDSTVDLAVSSVGSVGLPEPPPGIKKVPVLLGSALDIEKPRGLVKAWLPEVVQLKPLPIRVINGTFSAGTVQNAFQSCKDGMSGEKVVIEWSE